MSTRAVLIPLVLLLVLSACAAPIASPAIGTLTPASVDTVPPLVETATPQPTAPPATPTPAVPAETGAAGEEAIVAAAVEITAKALGVDPNAIQFVSIEAVQWPDSCLGVNLTDQACAEVITPGYRVVLEVDGARYAIHTNQDGSIIRFAGLTEPTAGAASGYLGIEWRSPSDPCQVAVITMNSVTFGPCGAAPNEIPLASGDRQDDLAYYISLYASFEASTPAGALRFTGAGPAVATSAEQRMMAEWAGLVAQEAETGRADVAMGLALAWHREGGFAGFCDDLAVYSVGNGLPFTCQTEPPTNLGKRWLAAGQSDQLFDWIDTLASFEYGKKDPATADAMTVQLVFAGTGADQATEQDRQAMLDFAAWLTTYGAQATGVRYIMALTDLPVTSGPGAQFAPVSELFSGQIAFVTGISPNQQWWRVICADGTVDNCWVSADPQLSQPTEPPGESPAGQTVPPWDPAEIYAAVIRQLYTVDHTFGKAPNFPVVYLVRQTSANAADPSATGGSETIFPGDQARIVALLGDLPAQFVWVDRMEDVPRAENGLVAGSGAIIQVGAITPQADGSLNVPGSIFISPLAAGGQTYVLQAVDGAWQITGKSGPVWMS